MKQNMSAERPNMRITPEIIKSSKTLTCTCGGMIFEPGIVFKKLSPIISPTGKESLLPLDVMVCSKCGKVPEEFNSDNILPEEVLTKKQIIK